MWFKFKNVATLIIETFHLLLLTVLLGNPFNVKQIDDIVVMASTAKITLASIIANSDVGSKATTTTTSATTTTPSSLAVSRLAAAPTSPAALFLLETTSSNQQYNLSFPQINDSNEIDSLNEESVNGERVLLKNYVMTKHIALSNNLAGETTSKALATMTTKLISTKLITHTATTTMNPVPSAINRKTTTSSSSAVAAFSSAAIDHSRFFFNKTQLDVLSSLSLLSLNDTTTELKSSAAAIASDTSSSASTSTLTFPNHAATALRHQGNEQNMHNTNSQMTVDNVNATIVSSATAAKTKTSTTTPTKTLAHIAKNSSNNSSNSNSSNDDSRTSPNLSGSSLSTVPRGNSSGANTGITRISARKVDSKYFLSKSHKTDAPMLNYIFDTFSSANKHHHHDQRYGPHFEDVELVGQPTNMTVQAGSSIHLNCRISLLQDKTVSWVRRNAQGENALDLLTVGLHAYTGDKRYKMEFQYPSNWRLKINNVKKDDEATYECQISTHPPRVIQINLHVNAPTVMIVDEFGDPLQEKYYEQDSTLQLSCIVRNVAMSSSVVYWKHIEDILNYDVTRGGVSVKTELMDDGANSTLFIAKINKVDSGNYTCSISEYQNYTIVVHILNGESFAELHHGSAIGWHQLNHPTRIINLILATILLLLLSAYIHR